MTLLEFFRRILRHLAAVLLFPSALKTVPVTPKSSPEVNVVETTSRMASLDSLKDEIMQLFHAPCTIRRMLSMSSALRIQYKAKLQESEACMLPSFCHALPNGQEKGTYIALDVGGSTFRVALIELRGKNTEQTPMVIKHMTTSKIDERTRKLPSTQFFDWMAGRIGAMLEHEKDLLLSREGQPVPMGLAWSFPIEQTSHRSGKMQGMGKGFACHEDTIGMDLAGLIEVACLKRNLNVRVDAIVNDSSATLLSQAYLDSATSMALILGTGTNAAVYLPTSCMGASKFGSRDPSWFKTAQKVITNTEVSMFGKLILPETRWDQTLNKQHHMPDFQPLEYMVTGRYLGELLRLIIVEAVETGELFNGKLPSALSERYSLDTEVLAHLEEDDSENLTRSGPLIKKAFGLKHVPSKKELSFLRTAAQSISYRASAYISTAVHALWALQKETDSGSVTSVDTPKTSIACNGSVILKYPGFKDRSEEFLHDMVTSSSTSTRGTTQAEKIVLVPTDEAALFGAAVAVALADGP